MKPPRRKLSKGEVLAAIWGVLLIPLAGALLIPLAVSALDLPLLTDAVNVFDQVAITALHTFQTPVDDSATVGDQVGVNILHTFQVPLSDTAHVSDQVNVSVIAVEKPIAATGVNISAAEGQAFSGTVSTFNDADPNSTSAEYAATIDWGDGSTTSAGAIGGPTGGPFTVNGAHTYAEEGTYNITVTISDVDTSSNTATTSSTGNAADALLTAGTLSLTGGTEGSGATTASFTFADANPGAVVADFTATINWGDTTSSAGTVSGLAGGPFTVSGSHTYAEEGTYTVTVTVTDDGGSTTSASGTVNVADALLTAGTLSLTGGTEGSGATTASFTFADANPGLTVADFSATTTISWGDGVTTAGTVSGPTGGLFTVSGSHTYAEEGPYAVTVKVMDDGGSTTSATGAANVADAPLTAGPLSLTGGTEGSGATTASFTFADANPGLTVADFSATTTISWGDGVTTAGTVSGPTGGLFTVSDSHTYAEEGPYTVAVTVTDVGGSTTSATGTANVADALLTAGPLSLTGGTEGAGATTASFTFTDANSASTVADFTATISWGDGSTSSADTTISGLTGGPYTVSGLHTYAEEGPYTVTVTITDDGGSTTSATGTVNVADALLTAGPLSLTGGTEGSGTTTASFTFTDGNRSRPWAGSTAADFTATISWGDATPSSAGTVTGLGGLFTVSGSHTYAEEGPYTVTVTVTDVGGSTTSATGTANVADALLTAVCAAPANFTPSLNPTATFTDAASPGGTLSDFKATIDWGDGSSSAGTVSGPNGGPYSVSGAHTYATTGNFTITTTITDVGGKTATTSCKVTAQDVELNLANVGGFTSGQLGAYVIFVTNTGRVATSGTLIVTDTLPAGLTYVGSLAPGWSCSVSGQTVTCTYAHPLAVHGITGLALFVKVTAPNGTVLTDTATVTPPDATPADNTASVKVTVKRSDDH